MLYCIYTSHGNQSKLVWGDLNCEVSDLNCEVAELNCEVADLNCEVPCGSCVTEVIVRCDSHVVKQTEMYFSAIADDFDIADASIFCLCQM